MIRKAGVAHVLGRLACVGHAVALLGNGYLNVVGCGQPLPCLIATGDPCHRSSVLGGAWTISWSSTARCDSPWLLHRAGCTRWPHRS